jgi:hypothetical protein
MAGNEAAWSGVYDSQEQAEQAAKDLTRTLYGSLTKESKARNIAGRGRIMSSITGMKDLLSDIQDYIGQLTIDDKQNAKEYIDAIIAQDSKTGILKTVIKVIDIINNKIVEIATNPIYLPLITEQKIGDSVKKQIQDYIADAKQNLKYLDFKTILMSAVPTLGTVAMMNTLEASGILRRTPELTRSHACLVGLVPLQHIREIEVARSGQVLKFRATGSVFLAKQKGEGKDAVRISGKFYREEIIILTFLLLLYEYGAANVGDIDLTTNLQPFDLQAIRKLNNILTVNTDKVKPSVEQHNTFPFVSRHVIIPNCYIETLSFEERIENGISVINYDILLRTFNKQKSFKVWNSDDDNTKYVATIYNENLRFHKMFEYGINAVWRYLQSEHFVVNTGYWKVGVTTSTYGSPLAKDVYYNVDALDVVGTFAMGAMGFVGKNFSTMGTTNVLNILTGVAT